jgi:hypothetical protein
LGLVLRALDALGIRLDASTESVSRRGAPVHSINIDDIVTAARKSKR